MIVRFSVLIVTQPFDRQPHKMVKHTQAIRPQQPTNCLSVFDHFVGLVLKGLTVNLVTKNTFNLIQRISKEFWLVTKEVKTCKSPNSSNPFAMKEECLKLDFHALKTWKKWGGGWGGVRKKNGFGAEENGLQVVYFHKWNGFLLFLFVFYFSVI